MLSVDLDASGHKWFQLLRAKYEADTQVELVQASDLVHELIHRRSLREQFFPGATPDLLRELKHVACGTSEKSLGSLASLTTESAQQYLDLLKEQDPRYSYELLFGGDLGPDHQGGSRGEIASVTDGSTTVLAFPRDLTALAQDPPKGTLKVRGSGADKLGEFIRTGKKQELVDDEIVEFTSTVPLLTDASGKVEFIALGPSSPGETMPLRVTFGSEPAAVTYDYIEFTKTRSGTEEMELVSVGELPFVLTLVVRLTGGIRFAVRARTDAYNLPSVKKFLTAIRALIQSNCVDFVMPSKITPADLTNLDYLLQLPDGVPLSTEETVTFEMEHPVEPIPTSQDSAMRGVNASGNIPGRSLALFGHSISTGPLKLTFEGGSVENFDEFKDWMDRAVPAECISLRVNLTNGGRLETIRQSGTEAGR